MRFAHLRILLRPDTKRMVSIHHFSAYQGVFLLRFHFRGSRALNLVASITSRLDEFAKAALSQNPLISGFWRLEACSDVQCLRPCLCVRRCASPGRKQKEGTSTSTIFVSIFPAKFGNLKKKADFRPNFGKKRHFMAWKTPPSQRYPWDGNTPQDNSGPLMG